MLCKVSLEVLAIFSCWYFKGKTSRRGKLRYIPSELILFALIFIENERRPNLGVFHTHFHISNVTCLNLFIFPIQ